METKKLNFEKMENIEGGSLGCAAAIASTAAAWGSAIVFTGGAAAAGLVIAGIYGGTLGLVSCAE